MIYCCKFTFGIKYHSEIRKMSAIGTLRVLDGKRERKRQIVCCRHSFNRNFHEKFTKLSQWTRKQHVCQRERQDLQLFCWDFRDNWAWRANMHTLGDALYSFFTVIFSFMAHTWVRVRLETSRAARRQRDWGVRRALRAVGRSE
jgi:hypothetical protein